MPLYSVDVPTLRAITGGFRGARFQSHSLTRHKTSMHIARSARSRPVTTYRNAPSSGAITGLSYPAILKGCPPKYQGFQLSPQPPDISRCPQQPTSSAHVRPLRAAHARDFHPFTVIRVRCVTTSPVSVSPNPSLLLGGLGRRGYFKPQRPTFVVPAQLRAYDFGSGNNGMASARCLRFYWQ